MAVITLGIQAQDQSLNRTGLTKTLKLTAGINSAYQLKIDLDEFWQERSESEDITIVFWRDVSVITVTATADGASLIAPVPEGIARGAGVFNVALQQGDLHSDSVRFEVGGMTFNPFDTVGEISTGVASFKGRTGAVVPQVGDYDITMVGGAVASFYLGDFTYVGATDPQTLTAPAGQTLNHVLADDDTWFNTSNSQTRRWDSGWVDTEEVDVVKGSYATGFTTDITDVDMVNTDTLLRTVTATYDGEEYVIKHNGADGGTEAAVAALNEVAVNLAKINITHYVNTDASGLPADTEDEDGTDYSGQFPYSLCGFNDNGKLVSAIENAHDPVHGANADNALTTKLYVDTLLTVPIPAPPDTGNFLLRSVDGVLEWVAE